MEKTIEIPEGYEARIEGNKVILEQNDESIRNFLYEFIKVCGWSEKQFPPKKRVLAYLERQKEPHFTKRNALFDKCVENCDPAVMKEVSDSIDKMLEKEQKPAEDKDTIKPTPKQDYSGLTDFERAIHRGFLCAGVENVPVGIIKDTARDCLAQIKPAEWSEKEHKLLNYAISLTDDAEVKTFLKSLRNQPKQKWSEVDKIHLMNAICAAEKKWGIDSCTANWLKSLRPSWKPSEEQRHIEGQDTCHLNKQKLVDFIEDCIAENLENTTQENRDNHEGYHQACWDILYFIKQASK